ncbi:MAG: pilus assembly protein PilA [Gammaproteobacteria bacterium RIFCSPHIGHO2_12_FULL_41_15]|nr:MAG: pilus assembly protein PilA [Gammaproteobacteria bacterium RIFCSPHIGHO2_12_FULL_41_15]
MRKMKQTGFSLMELIIVIAIIGILVAVAVPSYKNYTRRAHYTEIIQASAPYKTGIEQCYQLIGELDNCNAGENGVPNNIAESEGRGLVNHITVTNGGVITITPREKSGITSSDTYILTPSIENHYLTWTISGGATEKGYASK